MLFPFLPPDAVRHGPGVDRLFTIFGLVTAVALVAVQLALLWLIVAGRRRTVADPQPREVSLRSELLLAFLLLGILLSLALISRAAWQEMRQAMYSDIAADPAAFQVSVEAQQFQWNMTYAGADGKSGTADDVMAVNDFRVPLDRDVVVRLTSRDVIHSFFIPEFRLKQDALPGTTIRVRFHPTLRGEWELECAELCGLGHYRMRAAVRVMNDAELTTWMQTLPRAR